MNITPVDLLCFTSDSTLISEVGYLNDQYRKGDALVSDAHFDALFAELESRLPSHPLVTKVQTTLFDAKGRVAHPKPMLSTEKAYTLAEIKSWLERVADFTGETIEAGKTPIRISIKLDGCAARYTPAAEHKLVTRGDGEFGNPCHLVEHGLVLKGAIENSVGEVVCSEEYFQNHLKPHGVVHPRSFVAGLISAQTLSPIALKALQDGAVHLVAFADFPTNVVIPLCDVLGKLEEIEAELLFSSPYRADGIVLQVHDDALFDSMGSGSRSHRGQIAKKIAGEPKEALITGVNWQTGRSGRTTPILSIEATELSDSIVTSVTAHHAGNVKKLGLGAGAVGNFIKSGEIIPFLCSVLKRSDAVVIPTHCQHCSTELVWQNDFIVCTNVTCAGRVAAQLEFSTKTWEMDLIGQKAAERLANAGIDCLKLLSITDAELQTVGFGAGQSANIIAELTRIQNSPIDDYKVLASLGIHTLGKRASRTLLSEYPLAGLDKLTVEQVAAIAGFGDVKANAVVDGLVKNAELLKQLNAFFNTIVDSRIVVEAGAPLIGLNLVFTGTLTSGTRSEIQAKAEQLGAKIQSSPNKRTDYLVCGTGVGASKTNKASELGIKVITEAEYLAMIS